MNTVINFYVCIVIRERLVDWTGRIYGSITGRKHEKMTRLSQFNGLFHATPRVKLVDTQENCNELADPRENCNELVDPRVPIAVSYRKESFILAMLSPNKGDSTDNRG
jgi:hypothetical protein